jgi:hypothetical protein
MLIIKKAIIPKENNSKKQLANMLNRTMAKVFLYKKKSECQNPTSKPKPLQSRSI